jgi:CRP-like cAMP-binding protein
MEAADRIALRGAITGVGHFAPGECIHEQGDTPQGILILYEGVARAVRILGDGGQQILALFVPGDVLDCQPVAAPSAVRLCAVTVASVAKISRPALDELLRKYPSVGHALWRETARHAAIQQEWLVSVGRQNAYARLAHFICEISLRFRASGLADAESCPFPLTQCDIADALGISSVHVNRMLQRLRGERLLALSRGSLHIIDHDGLYRAAGFDPSYLGDSINVGE